MAVTTRVYTPSNIIQGPADVFIDVQVPPSAVPPVQGTNAWSTFAGSTYLIDANGQPTDNGTAGSHIGGIVGPMALSSTPKFDEIRDDQHGAAIDAAFGSLETEIDFEVNEFFLDRLAKYFSSPLGTFTNVAAGANPACKFLQIGSPQSSAMTFHPLLVTSPDRTAVGKYWAVQAYKAYLNSAIATSFQRNKAATWKLKFRCIADITRALTDQVYQVVRGL